LFSIRAPIARHLLEYFASLLVLNFSQNTSDLDYIASAAEAGQLMSKQFLRFGSHSVLHELPQVRQGLRLRDGNHEVHLDVQQVVSPADWCGWCGSGEFALIKRGRLEDN